jgi:hypothetical protein
MDDVALLRAFSEQHSEEAFRDLVHRHLPVVYAAALRQVNGDAHLAEDIAQRVFVAVARKAGPLTRHPSIIGWLYTAARREAARVVRAELRRRRREEESAAGLAPQGQRLGPIYLRSPSSKGRDGLPSLCPNGYAPSLTSLQATRAALARAWYVSAELDKSYCHERENRIESIRVGPYRLSGAAAGDDPVRIGDREEPGRLQPESLTLWRCVRHKRGCRLARAARRRRRVKTSGSADLGRMSGHPSAGRIEEMRNHRIQSVMGIYKCHFTPSRSAVCRPPAVRRHDMHGGQGTPQVTPTLSAVAGAFHSWPAGASHSGVRATDGVTTLPYSDAINRRLTPRLTAFCRRPPSAGTPRPTGR